MAANDLFPKEIGALIPPLEPLVDRILPGRDMDGKKAERLRDEAEKQKMDAVKGLVWLASFREIGQWSSEDVDPIQRASVPLLARPSDKSDNGPEPNLLVVHEYNGGYHEYETSGIVGAMETDFTMGDLQSVETFVYSAKHLVNIAPPAWTNLLHKNGVKVLGTLYIDRETLCAKDLFRYKTLNGTNNRTYLVAGTLAKMARTYGFDGWMISIGTGFESYTVEHVMMIEFLNQLRIKVADEYGTKGSLTQIVWHDSFISANRVAPQDTVTKYNDQYFAAAGSILTGTRWTPTLMEDAVDACLECNLPTDKVYFAIDVRAQSEPTPGDVEAGVRNRKAWPRDNGGGTNTALAINEIARIGTREGVRLGAAVVGPSWVVEHFAPQDVGDATLAVWHGRRLPPDCSCACPAGDVEERGGGRHERPSPGWCEGIVHIARHAPAGTADFLWADFQPAFAAHHPSQNKLFGGLSMHAQLASQSVGTLDATAMAVVAPGRLLLRTKPSEELPGPVTVYVPRMAYPTGGSLAVTLFELNMAFPRNIDWALFLRVGYRRMRPTADVFAYIELEFELRPEDLSQARTWKAWHALSEGTDSLLIQELATEVRCPHLFEMLDGEIRLARINFLMSSPLLRVPRPEHVPVAELHHVSITPLRGAGPDGAPVPRPPVAVENVRVAKRGHGATKHFRLVWDLRDDSAASEGAVDGATSDAAGLPISAVTGRVAHCEVLWEGRALTRVYGCQLVMSEEMVREWEKATGFWATVVPVAFGGQVWPGTKVLLSRPVTDVEDPADEWVELSEEQTMDSDGSDIDDSGIDGFEIEFLEF